MFNFFPEKIETWPFVILEENFWFKFFKVFKFFFLIFALLSLYFSFSLFVFFLFLFYLFSYFYLFFEIKLKKKLKELDIKNAFLSENQNLADFLNFDCQKAIYFALKEKERKKKNFIDSSLLFISLFKVEKDLSFIFNRQLLDLQKINSFLLESYLQREENENEIFSQDFQSVIKKAIERAISLNKKEVSISDLLWAILKENENLEQIRIKFLLKKEDFDWLIEWYEYLKSNIEKEKKFWEKENLLKWGSLGRDLAEGFTPTLDNFSLNIFFLLKQEGFKKIFAHQKEVEELERMLAGLEKNDVLIVGNSGSGRRSIVEEFARRSFLGQSLENLNHQRILYFDLAKVIASSNSIQEAEFLIDRCFYEATTAGNVILVLDNLHNFIGVEGELGRRPGVVEISGLLGKYIPYPSFRFIGITTFEGLHRNIEKKPELSGFVQKIEIKEVTPQETMWILGERALRLEAKYRYKIFVSFPALRDIVFLTDKYLPSLSFPEKAIDLLDELFIYAKREKKKVILSDDVKKMLSQKTEIPLTDIEEKEKEVLLDLENLLHQKIVDQNEAIFQISNALRRARTGVQLRKGPMGSFLFLGPTGVGKTETAKALAEIYFGSEEKIIRLDMSEFQRLEDIPRLLGAEGQEGLLTTPVRENPFSLILLDEFEKAHKDIFNLFLQVLDEGHLTDGWGRKVDFRNTIIIATSNAGYQMIFEAVKKGEALDVLKERLIDFFVENSVFRPELLNRFDGVIIFRPLSQEDLLMIADLLLKKLQKKLKEREIDFIITQDLKEKIVEISFKPEFGAREMQRVIQEKVGNPLALFLLENKVAPGSKLKIDPQDFKVIYNP